MATRIKHYTPSGVDKALWAEVEDDVRALAFASEPMNMDETQRMLSHLARLFVWAVEQGRSTEPSRVLAEESIEAYLAGRSDDLTSTSIATARAALRRVRSRAVDGALAPHSTISYSPSNAPYSPAERARIISIANAQQIRGRREDLWTLIALSLGAGLRSREIIPLRCGQISRADGCVVVTLAPTRRVAVLARYESELDRLFDRDHAAFAFRPGCESRGRQLVSNFTNQIDGLDFNTDRARITWIVHQLDAGTPVTAVAAALGATTGSFVRSVLPYLAVRSDDEVLAATRDAQP